VRRQSNAALILSWSVAHLAQKAAEAALLCLVVGP
jgi:hypothetical protein